MHYTCTSRPVLNRSTQCATIASSFCSDNQEYSFEAVKTWTSEDTLRTAGQASRSVLDCTKLFFPIHLQSGHWTLAVVDLQQHTAIYYDSLWVCLVVVHPQNVCMSPSLCQMSPLNCWLWLAPFSKHVTIMHICGGGTKGGSKSRPLQFCLLATLTLAASAPNTCMNISRYAFAVWRRWGVGTVAALCPGRV